LSIVKKHVAQTCGYITLAESQALYHMSVFNSKIPNLQMWKYDINMTSPVSKNIQLFHGWNTSFLLDICRKFLWKCKHFPWRYKRKRKWVFFSEHGVVHYLTDVDTGKLLSNAVSAFEYLKCYN